MMKIFSFFLFFNQHAKRPDVGNWISCVAVDDAEQWLVS